MEIKNTLEKPYTENQKIDFIVENNHNNGYEIRETDVALEAWGYTEEEIILKLKENKKQEASQKAYEYIETSALFEFEEGKHIEATDGNISKLGLALMELLLNQDTISTIDWCTYENETVQLNAEYLTKIVEGLKDEQTFIWTVKFPYFLQLIDEAKTIKEVEAIEINYGQEIAVNEINTGEIIKTAEIPELPI